VRGRRRGAVESGLPGGELQARRRGEQIVRLPGVPGYLIHTTSTATGAPQERPRRLRRAWERVPPRTRRIAIGLAVVAFWVLLAILGGEGGGGGG
jgi:hypothetical protein